MTVTGSVATAGAGAGAILPPMQDKGKQSGKRTPPTAKQVSAKGRTKATAKRANIEAQTNKPARKAAAHARVRAQVSKERVARNKSRNAEKREAENQAKRDTVAKVKRNPTTDTPKRPRTQDRVVGTGGNRGSAFNNTPKMPNLSYGKPPVVPKRGTLNRDGTRYRSV